MYFKIIFMKIDQIVARISTFEVPGSKWNILLPTGDVGREIKYAQLGIIKRVSFL